MAIKQNTRNKISNLVSEVACDVGDAESIIHSAYLLSKNSEYAERLKTLFETIEQVSSDLMDLESDIEFDIRLIEESKAEGA